jgi:hypothetical protein
MVAGTAANIGAVRINLATPPDEVEVKTAPAPLRQRAK